jgi:hyperosmotically inducible periplasmic protein
MKTIGLIGLAVTTWLVAASTAAWSQNDQTASASAGAQASSGIAASGRISAAGRKADRALRRKVYAAFGKDKQISAGDISVIAKDGAVTLNGTVTEAEQIGKAEAIAKGVSGVKSVTNGLTVKKPLGGM